MTIRVLRSKVRISRTCIHTTFFLRMANVRACFYLWRSWKHDHSRTIYCSVRGFFSKHLCFGQFFSRAAECTTRAQLASLLELEHLPKLTAKADAAEWYVSPFVPAKQESKNSTYIDSAGSRAEHQSKFRAHVQLVMHAS